jgi:SAM-dependent methyltransferase
MPSCCYRDEYGDVFRPEEAEAQARAYRRHGLRGTNATMMTLLRAEGFADADVLEVGAGVGEVLVSALREGATRAYDVDLSAPWVEAARRFVAEQGLAERFDARAGDFVDLADDLPRFDVVILHRVVCCYPDWSAMLGAAAGRTRRLLALVYPSDRWWTRAGIVLANVYFRLRGLRFRVFVHPEAPMTDLLAQAGLEVVRARRGLVWRTVVLRRTHGD